LKKYDIGNIVKCDYEWEVDTGDPSEWISHIISLDNYIRKLDKQYYIEDFGTYRIDDVSDFSIKKSNTKNLNMCIETELLAITVNLGKTNSFEIISKKDNSILEKKIFEDEGYLAQQLELIFMQDIPIKLQPIR
jgi:hypothetical protein